jgi:hypothetical protein
MSKIKDGVELEFLYSKMESQRAKKAFKWHLSICFQVKRNIILLLAIRGPILIAIVSFRTSSVKTNKNTFVTIDLCAKLQKNRILIF